jgi:hypothetical protein
MGTRLVFTLAVGSLLVGVQGGWQPAFSQANPPPAAGAVLVAEEKTTAATVEDVDPRAHHVLLRLPDDTLVTLKVGSRVKNLAQLKPGDHITAKYVEARLLGVNETASASGPIQHMSAESGDTVRGPTTIVAVDPAKHVVSFVGPNNVVETIAVGGDAMIKAVTRLKPGDKADIDYTPAVALNLDRA